MAIIKEVGGRSTGSMRYRIEFDGGGGATKWIVVNSKEITVFAGPRGGANVSAEVTYCPLDVVLGDNQNGTTNAAAVPWQSGLAATPMAEEFKRVTAVRFTSTGAGVAGYAA